MSQERGTQKSRLLSFYNLDVPYFHYKRDRVSTLIPKERIEAQQDNILDKQNPAPHRKQRIWQLHAWHLVLMMELSGDEQSWVAIFLWLSITHMTSFKTASVHTFQLSSADFWHVGAGFHDPITLAFFLSTKAAPCGQCCWGFLQLKMESTPIPHSRRPLCNVGTFENTFPRWPLSTRETPSLCKFCPLH